MLPDSSDSVQTKKTTIREYYLKNLLANVGKLLLNHRQKIVGNFAVIPEINLFSLREMLNGW